jgi:hypothetical protein
MKPLELAARFAAFTWYTNCRQAPPKTTQAEARRFSNESWPAFLPLANEGLGRLLLKVANTRPTPQRLSMTNRPTRRRPVSARGALQAGSHTHVPHDQVLC